MKDLAIIGAGPYGLATAAYAKHLGLDYVLLGRPMELWRAHMLEGMLLRSPVEWHLDPTNERTITKFLDLTRPDSTHLSTALTRRVFLDYVDWFMRGHSISPDAVIVERVTKSARGGFDVEAQGKTLHVRNVVVATGLRQFRHVPPELSWLIQTRRASHSSDHTGYESFRDKSVLVVGGRQSAYEAVKELSSLPGTTVHVCHRHPVPTFAESNWSWINRTVEFLLADANWFAAMPEQDKRAIEQRFWSEGREKLEPWLQEGASRTNVEIHPLSHVVKAEGEADYIDVTLSDGTRLRVDHVIFATGFKVDIAGVTMLRELLPEVSITDGYPDLDVSMQSSVPGLYFTGLFCTRQFGPIFGFTLGCQVAPRIIVDALAGAKPARTQ